ncbi:MAG: ATP-binding protein [Gammaproteobacteria bacterium]|nr:ATP-binding protein [Gammaproteobacteria bacterium]MBU1414999.1 ATP-binding protein [Gammaproteobacteria bacterium]
MIHYLPTIRSQEQGFTNLAILAVEAKELTSSRLEVDFSRCGFFDANMAAPLAAILARVADAFNAVTVVNVPSAIERILRKNRFLAGYGYAPMDDANRTTLPFRRIQLSEQGLFADYLEQHMNGKGIPRMTEGLGKVFRQSIFEVFQNTVIHSASPFGAFVCGQFYPQYQRLDLTISDAGVGIRTNVRRYLGQAISSVEAIRWALQDGNTTKTGSQPGGVGLKFLHDFVALNQGKIQIASRLGFYEYRDGKETFKKLAADFPGTTVNLEINTGDTSAYRLNSEITAKDIF